MASHYGGVGGGGAARSGRRPRRCSISRGVTALFMAAVPEVGIDRLDEPGSINYCSN